MRREADVPRPMADRARLHLYGVAHAYGRRTVLRSVELEVGPGEIVGVAGPSGSGKSTLLRIAAGLERPGDGRVLADGEDLWPAKRRQQPRYPRRGWVGAVFQDPASSLDPAWTLRRVLDEPFRVPGRRRASVDERQHLVQDALGRVGLADLSLDRRPPQLSGGEQQRVALARCLLGEPALLVADEPTSALDVTNSAAVMRALRATAQRGASVLIVSHDRPMLDALADRVLRCERGTLHG